MGCSVPTTAQALQPVADRLVDSPLRNGAAGGGAGSYRALAHQIRNYHGSGSGGDGDTDLGRLDDIADDDEADFTDTDALLEYLLRDRHTLAPTLLSPLSSLASPLYLISSAIPFLILLCFIPIIPCVVPLITHSHLGRPNMWIMTAAAALQQTKGRQ